MSPFLLTCRSIHRRKSWVICAFAVGVLPFLLPYVSAAAENASLYKPALAQATWALAWICALGWGFFTAAHAGDKLAQSGTGEFFSAAGIRPWQQLLSVWLANLCFVAPLGIIAALVAIAGASPALADERAAWIATNFQYTVLFILAVGPLLALSIAIASRFGAIAGFFLSGSLAIYGLYGVGYLKLLTSLEDHPVLTWLARISPHYHLADPTERLRYKMGEIDWSGFPLLLAYFFGIALFLLALSRAVFRTRATA
ncbi:MAG: hypothetical protein MUF31_18080 [Akkermansiaceae bacterium]|jgi:hypothetical protein|nr:hypothetical protein [Akkermansiaceae bacterium]